MRRWSDMEAFVRGYERFFDERGDPRVRDWPFMRDLSPTGCILLVYWALVYFLPLYMKNRKPYELSGIIKCYNVLQILINVKLLHEFLNCGWIQGDMHLGCEPIDYSDHPYAVRSVTAFYWIYWLKVFELIETIFFVLRKKMNQVSGLHVYHHSGTLLLAFSVCKFCGGGMLVVPLMMNLVVHIFMYLYYFLASLGPEWQKRIGPWKSRLTVLQMVQFSLILIHSASFFKPGCNVPLAFAVPFVLNTLVLFKMFYDFFKRSYDKMHKQAKKS